MKWLLRSHKRNTSSGFTLTELLVATAISGIALTIAGVGLVAIMQKQRESSTEVGQRTNFNRALDFIANEVRMANTVQTPTSGSVPIVPCGTATGVLELTIPKPGLPAAQADRVVYYLQTLNGCPNSAWLNPGVIRRKYINASNSTLNSDSILIDAVAAPTTLPGCPSGITRVGGNGFYACIGSNNRTVDLYLYGQLADSYGSTLRDASGNIITYPVSSQVSVRSF